MSRCWLTGVGGQGIQLLSRTWRWPPSPTVTSNDARQLRGTIRGGQTEGLVDRRPGSAFRSLPIIPSAWAGICHVPPVVGGDSSASRSGGPVVVNSCLLPRGLVTSRPFEGFQVFPIPAATIGEEPGGSH